MLNAVFYRLVKYVDQIRYNGYVRHLNGMTAHERRERLSQTAILHYNGNSKPWEETYSQLCADLFWQYAQEVTDCGGRYEAMKASQRNARRRYLRAQKKKKEKEKAEKAGNNSGTV